MNSDRLLKILRDEISHYSFNYKNKIIEIISNNVSETGLLLLPWDNNSMRLLDPNEVLYVSTPQKGKVHIHTLTSEIPFHNSAYSLLEYLVEKNKNYCYLNKGFVINKDKIMNFNSYYRRVFFINGQEVRVTGEAIKILIKALGKEKDIHHDTVIGNFEY